MMAEREADAERHRKLARLREAMGVADGDLVGVSYSDLPGR